MKYIQIDTLDNSICIVSEKGKNGKPLVFDTLEEAKNSLAENCKKGIVVPLGNFIKTLEDCSHFIGIIKLEEGEGVGGDLEDEVNRFLK